MPDIDARVRHWPREGLLVIVGGWAHRLYRDHPLAQPLEHEPLTTLDADVAIPDDLTPAAANIRTRLLERAFQEEFIGDEHPPVTHYRWKRTNRVYSPSFSHLSRAAATSTAARLMTRRRSAVSRRRSCGTSSCS